MLLAEAMEQARKLPPPPTPGEVITMPCLEVLHAWMQLHGLTVAKTPLDKPRWHGGVLVVTHPHPEDTDEFGGTSPPGETR